MIIQEQVKDVVVIGEDTSKKAKISQDKLAKLQYLLTKGLYKDPITAVIAEWTNNGIDSVVQWGGKAVHQFHALGLSHFKLPRTEKLFRDSLMIPLYPELEDSKVEYVINKIKSFYHG